MQIPLNRRKFLISLASFALAKPILAQEESSFALALVEAARAQIGVTLRYDGGYSQIDYPWGDIPRSKGVCTDVVIRAFRDAHSIDLQMSVHEDMKANFSAYPKIWGLSSTDSNIDHRRVANLERYFERNHQSLEIGEHAEYQAGDIVSWRLLRGGTPHIGIISDQFAPNGNSLVIHNIGLGAKEDDIIFAFEMIGHYRWLN